MSTNFGALLGGVAGGQVNSAINSPAKDPTLDLLGLGLNAVIPGSGIVLNLLSGIFGGSRPNPNDWMGWDALDSQYNSAPGSSPAHWVLNDGDSVPNEAANIISYIKNKNGGLGKVVQEVMNQARVNADQALSKLYSKLEKGGFADAASAIRQGLQSEAEPTPNPVKSSTNGSNSTSGSGSNSVPNNNSNSTPPPPDKKDNTLLYVVIALAVAVVAVFALKIK